MEYGINYLIFAEIFVLLILVYFTFKIVFWFYAKIYDFLILFLKILIAVIVAFVIYLFLKTRLGFK